MPLSGQCSVLQAKAAALALALANTEESANQRKEEAKEFFASQGK